MFEIVSERRSANVTRTYTPEPTKATHRPGSECLGETPWTWQLEMVCSYIHRPGDGFEDHVFRIQYEIDTYPCDDTSFNCHHLVSPTTFFLLGVQHLTDSSHISLETIISKAGTCQRLSLCSALATTPMVQHHGFDLLAVRSDDVSEKRKVNPPAFSFDGGFSAVFERHVVVAMVER